MIVRVSKPPSLPGPFSIPRSPARGVTSTSSCSFAARSLWPPGPRSRRGSSDAVEAADQRGRMSIVSRSGAPYSCRLLCEHHGVVGPPTQTLIPWPSQASLRRAAAFWSDDAAAALWTRLSDPETASREPIGEARFASKYALDGLRYLYLSTGCRETAARTDPGACCGQSTWVLAGRHRRSLRRGSRAAPPPVAGSGRSERYLEAAFACACEVAARA